MAEQFYTILTATGKAKIANANALGTKLNITKLQVGDGGGSYYNPTEDQTELKHKVWEGNISSITVDENNKNWIVIETLLPGDIGGFMIREAGVFDNENNLIAIGKYPETYKPVTSEGSLKDLKIRMILEVSNAANVTLKVDPTVILATQKDLQFLQNKINETNEQVKNIELTAEKVSIKDTANKFTSENVEGALKECIEKAEQAFQSGVNVKNNVVTALTSKGISVTTNDDWNNIISKINELTKFNEAQGHTTRSVYGNQSTPLTIYSGLTFTPKLILISAISDRNTISSGYYLEGGDTKSDGHIRSISTRDKGFYFELFNGSSHRCDYSINWNAYSW